eukprot:gene12762-15605_t
MKKEKLRQLFLFYIVLLGALQSVYAQKSFKTIPLPDAIKGVNEEFSGMALSAQRLYLLPQYGSHKETKLDSAFNIYSIHADSIGRIIDAKDTALTRFSTIKVKNLEKLPDSVKAYYEDPAHFCSLKRYPFIKNAGFESLAYLSGENKLIAMYEFNALPEGGNGFLIDTAFKETPKKIAIPFLPFRITDIQINAKGKIYGINYYWNGDYEAYLDNNILRHQEEHLKYLVPDLKASLNQNPDYLKEKTAGYARIVSLENLKDNQWKQVVSFDPWKNNWEGLSLFRNGALIISDANRSKKQVTTLAYIEF